MIYGYAGSLLRVNLSEKVISSFELSKDLAHEWIGGTGLGVKILFDEVAPTVKWDSSGNKVIMSAGPLSGTPGIGSGTFGLVTIGAMTGGICASQANGCFGPFLRSCGYDALILEGQSNDWVYLYIDENKVEIRPADHLLGLDTTATQDRIHEENGTNRHGMSIYCIGPAGENLVNFACLIGDYGHVAAHNGNGAVLGAKRIKAIAVKKGKKKVNFYNKEALVDAAKKMNEYAKESRAGADTAAYGTIVGFPPAPAAGVLPVKNLTTSIFPEASEFDPRKLRNNLYDIKRRPCFGCNWSHCVDIKFKEGPYKDLEEFEEAEYELMAGFGSVIGVNNPADAMVLANYVDRLGMDGNETSWVVAWCIECYEKGYFTKEDFGGLELGWGNVESTRKLIEMIAYRRGFGDILAGGARRAAKHVGGPAHDCAVFTEKGNTPRGHDHRSLAMWPEYLDVHVSSTGTIEVVGGFLDVTQHGLQPRTDPSDWQQVARQNAGVAGRRVFEDSLGVCRFMTENIQYVIEAVNASTGEEYDLNKIMRIGKKIINLMRIYNLLRGITVAVERPSPRYGSPVVDGACQGVHPGKYLPEMRSMYFELMGWDKNTGIPLPETLKELGLSDLIEVVRGINVNLHRCC
ncbi:aldehyde ferredoxin oxidoreductase family protein [Neomoorella mulderi]|uniref:Putative oxidoreductase YdhV n=1 Tax=Moorella mulderi DSM 14980 TaxID=1122241 RepID=A0A151AVQ7_9FIRM|nr:aldehyde ferredoxin oxidoreductase C-terminal domain-containing protein [Moorella mulderi]KYH31487.1 putative oxidoreductase YdhV [Moorella mulderi DSM 14980]